MMNYKLFCRQPESIMSIEYSQVPLGGSNSIAELSALPNYPFIPKHVFYRSNLRGDTD